MSGNYEETLEDIETLKRALHLPITNFLNESPRVISQSEEDIKNNGWNNTLERLLQQWGEQSKGFQWMYNKTSRKYERWNRILGFASIALGSTAGTLSFINLLFTGEAITILAGLSGYVASMFGAMYQFLDLEKRVRQHKIFSIKYQNLATDIEYQLSLFRRDRLEGKKYMKEIKVLYDRYKGDAPPVPDDITHAFNKMFGEKNISKPDIAGEISKIIIKSNDSSSSASSSSSSEGNSTPPQTRKNLPYIVSQPDSDEIIIQIENNDPNTLKETAKVLAKHIQRGYSSTSSNKRKTRKRRVPPAPPSTSNDEDGYATT